MNYIFIIFLSTLFLANCTKIDVNLLRCLVCETSIEELEKAVKQLDPTKTVDVGGYRLDVDGNYNHKSVSQTKSELHLSELIENVCEKMDDYVRATFKSNGTLTLLRLMTDNGSMNSAMSEVDIIQDDDLNKSLKYNCETIMEEYEENIIKLYQNDAQNVKKEICSEETTICRKNNDKQEL